MGCCSSNLKSPDLNRTYDAGNSSIYGSKRSRSRSSSFGSHTTAITTANTSGLGSSCSTPQRNRSIWSRSQTRPICDDFAEQPLGETVPQAQTELLDRSCGYYTCSSAASTPSKRQLRCTQEMDEQQSCHSMEVEVNTDVEVEESMEPVAGNLEWEMFMMQHAQRIMPKTSSPVCQRRLATPHDLSSRPYQKWRHYLQSTPAHMLHNVTHIPEAIAGQFCPTDFPAFSDLEEMENAAKRFKVDEKQQAMTMTTTPLQQRRQQQHLTHTISTDL